MWLERYSHRQWLTAVSSKTIFVVLLISTWKISINSKGGQNYIGCEIQAKGYAQVTGIFFIVAFIAEMIMVALTCAFIKETSQSKQLNWHHYLYHMLIKNKDNSNKEKHVVFLVQFQSTVSGSYFLIRWVMSLPSVWRSSVTRSWTSVTITWSIAIAGSGSKNWVDSIERVLRRVFKLMLARWRSQPIKYRVWEQNDFKVSVWNLV